MSNQILGAGSKSIAVSFILFSIALSYSLPAFPYYGTLLISSFILVIIAYSILYGIYLSKPSALLGRSVSLLFVLSIILFLLSTTLYLFLGQTSVSGLHNLLNITAYFMMLLLLFFIIEIYFYSGRKFKPSVIIVIVLLVAIYFSVIYYYADDETVLSYYGLTSFLNGSNPYSQSFSSLLYNLHMSNGLTATISTNNSIMGGIQYPALFFLSELPFYPLAGATYLGLAGAFLRVQAITFFLLFLLAYVLVAKGGTRRGPAFLLYLSLALMFNSLSAIMVFLMVALILMQYTEIGSRYSWLFLGLAASIQEQLWVLVVLFIAYSFNNYGIKRGLMELAGVIAVFLAINGYFIALGLGNFINNIFGTTTSIIPNSMSPLGYLILANLHVLLHDLSYVFGISIILAVLISIYVNDKKLIALFSIIPFLFLGHGIPLYYLLPIVVFTIVTSIDYKEKSTNLLKKALRKSPAAKSAYFGAIGLSVLSIIIIILVSNNAYSINYGLSSSNVTISRLNSTTLVYASHINYKRGTSMSLYLLIQENVPGNEGGFFGLYNQSLIKGSLNCSFPCSINVNRINLTGSGSYNLTAYIPANIATPAYLSAVLYNKDFYYVSQPVAYR